MPATATTAPLDRWDLIADRLWQLPELGWAIAEANPDLADLLVLPAGISVAVPELESLRRPLTAANPAREEGAGFIEVPGGPSPLPSPSPSPGAITFPIKIEQGGTEATTSQQALANLGAIAIASKGVPGGVAPLDGEAIVPSTYLPPYPTLASLGGLPASAVGASVAPLSSGVVPIQFLPPYPTLGSLGGIPINAIGQAGGVAPLDSNSLVPAINLPPYPTLASLGALAASSRNAANGVAPLDANSLIPINNIPLNSAFPFTNGASFRGGSSPATTPTLVQIGVDSNGLPRYWLVNANAPANSRIKSITVANNGNVQIRHHNDDLSDGNVLEHTASGNVLTNGTLRPGSGVTAFSGASFLPGAVYFRSDLVTPHVNTSGAIINSIGELTYSDGERWRRVNDGIDTSIISKIILTGTLPVSITANTYTNFGTINSVGIGFLESVYLISVYFQFTDGTTATTSWWQYHGAGIITSIQWKAAGTQTPVIFRIEQHNGNDMNCSARLSIANSNRILQLAFDAALSFPANSSYRITLKRLL